ncbi:hypothetical protein CWI61_02145, partial [Neisseria meningitidis]
LKQLGCKQAATMWTVWAETPSRFKAAANALEALNAHADAEHAAKIRPMLPEIRNLSSVWCRREYKSRLNVKTP